jgi:hypothetical protein
LPTLIKKMGVEQVYLAPDPSVNLRSSAAGPLAQDGEAEVVSRFVDGPQSKHSQQAEH